MVNSLTALTTDNDKLRNVAGTQGGQHVPIPGKYWKLLVAITYMYVSSHIVVR